jgi:WD40 repeat protein
VLLMELAGGHTGSILTVGFSPDGTRIASGAEDNTVILWNAAAGQLLLALTGHANAVTCVAFSPDGLRVASGSRDNTIRVWDASSGKLLRQMNAGATVNSLAYSPDGKTLACGFIENRVQLWNVEMITLVWMTTVENEIGLQIIGSTGEQFCVAFSPDGRTVAASGSRSWDVSLWAAADGQLRRTLQGHTGWAARLAFSPNGQWLASLSWESTVILWDPATGQQVHTLQGHLDAVLGVAFDPSSTRLLSGGNDRTVRFWDVATGQPLHTTSLPGLSNHVHFRFEADGTVTIATSVHTTIQVWRLPLPA